MYPQLLSSTQVLIYQQGRLEQCEYIFKWNLWLIPRLCCTHTCTQACMHTRLQQLTAIVECCSLTQANAPGKAIQYRAVVTSGGLSRSYGEIPSASYTYTTKIFVSPNDTAGWVAFLLDPYCTIK